jgi:hypothetical protein
MRSAVSAGGPSLFTNLPRLSLCAKPSCTDLPVLDPPSALSSTELDRDSPVKPSRLDSRARGRKVLPPLLVHSA